LGVGLVIKQYRRPDLKEMIAFCGWGCQERGAFLATKENDDQRRFEVAQEWSRQFLNTVMIDDKRGMVGRSRVFSPSWPEVYFYVFHFL